ncbi:Pycsar system effector family protein [Sphingobacterium yanglingense]|uniref:Putative metal-dependent HD superfamily phosphohydrolase n=1 Tax=Sphingobacterium yanglingense TaxID=1437280 RepID=A0A4R6WGI3_9SPHI|nr:Pycsar system effector family protein [Sphingobacterium yanglingense]TDQ77323.1 putative metal-dependent HD superfamily phosphohydrolase [Sphingobacterium yanglingense]
MEYEYIIEQIPSFLKKNIQQSTEDIAYCFHNETHVSDVVAAVREMADHYMLSSKDRFIVITAAYFHDVGYFPGGAQDHEVRSAELADQFLLGFAVDEEVRQQIRGCILATKMPQRPEGLLQEIVCDADLFHLGGINFSERNKLMRREVELVKGQPIDKALWRLQTIKLMENHHYHTQYARGQREKLKQQNLKSLMDKNSGNVVEKQNTVKLKEKKSRPERGIETMFRITSSNNQRLSDMADNKANILLTVNSIILSVVAAGLLRKLDSNEHLIIPTFTLMTAVVITMVLAILATIPKIPSGFFKEEEVQNKTVNLLFFGNFFKMPFDAYKAGMEEVMEDSGFLYGMMTKDVYSQGVVLGRKYRLLRYAYGIFMFGLVLSVIAFFIAIITY